MSTARIQEPNTAIAIPSPTLIQIFITASNQSPVFIEDYLFSLPCVSQFNLRGLNQSSLATKTTHMTRQAILISTSSDICYLPITLIKRKLRSDFNCQLCHNILCDFCTKLNAAEWGRVGRIVIANLWQCLLLFVNTADVTTTLLIYTMMIKMHWPRKDITMIPAIPLPLSAAQDDRDLLCWILSDFTDYDSYDADDL